VFQARRNGVTAVVIGVDPHKLSVTTEVLDELAKRICSQPNRFV